VWAGECAQVVAATRTASQATEAGIAAFQFSGQSHHRCACSPQCLQAAIPTLPAMSNCSLDAGKLDHLLSISRPPAEHQDYLQSISRPSADHLQSIRTTCRALCSPQPNSPPTWASAAPYACTEQSLCPPWRNMSTACLPTSLTACAPVCPLTCTRTASCSPSCVLIPGPQV